MPKPDYLQPYLQAAERHGGGFGSLLWASPKSQAVRFRSLARLGELKGRIVVDAGCGRGDLLDYLLKFANAPSRYIGLEAVAALAQAAEARNHAIASIVRGDFVLDPGLFKQRADVIVFSGSLNTLAEDQFYATLSAAWKQARRGIAFNFLCSPRLAAGKHLTWHAISDVLNFVNAWSTEVAMDDRYLEGDCTVVARK
ncbi:MAG: hypothetical protein M3O30_17685 [Planctomycetota bacterium]|nr:hypothetical protein [Planctomycetota bacterium]